MSNMRVAATPQRRIKPAFTVQKLEGKRKMTLIGRDAKGNKQEKVVEVDAGYMVKFSKGHSIRVANDAELKRLGFDQTIPLIDDGNQDADEAVGYIDNPIAAAAS